MSPATRPPPTTASRSTRARPSPSTPSRSTTSSTPWSRNPPWTISGATTGVEAGQTVTVSLNGHDYTGTVAADHTWSTSVAQADVAALSDGGSYTVHASVSDVAGNPAAADHSLAVDESAAITINTIALDDVVNALESQSALTISGATTGVEAGQTVTVSLNGHDYTGTVAADHTWSTSVAQADVAALSDGGSYTVHASVSDVAGNPAAADHSLAVDESAAITINTIALDDVVNALESQSALTISGATTGVEAGQTVTVSLNGHDYTGTVAADHTWSTSVAQADVAALSDGGSYTVHASVSDVAGNPAAADHSLAVDESAAITINTIALDDVVNALESQSALTISGATTGVEAGQTVTVSLNGHDYTGTVAADHTWSTSVAQADVAALSDGGSYTVHASVSDVAGNPAAADHSLAVDESAAITINTIALDDVVNALESQSALTISGATTGVEAGQTVTVSLNGHDYTGTVAADHTWSTSVAQADVAALSDGGSYTVHASVSDVAGNPAAADHSLAVDESAAITINTIALDDVVNALESQSALTISGATTGVEAGQTVTVSLNGHDYTGTVAADHTWSTSVAQADVAALSDGGSYTVHASVSDVAGNPAAADHSLAVDESAAITINTIALDDVVNALESQSALTISGATTGVEAGQTVTVSLNGHDYTGTVAADHTWSTSVAQADVAALSDGGSYTVHASVSDVAGNPAAADHSLAVDESAAITINTIALDDVVNALESQSALTISGATTGVEAGQTVTVSLNGHDYTGTVAADHTWSTSVAQADVAALSDGGSYTVHASVSDVAGNPAAADHSLAVDESAAITINTIALDDVVNALESQSALTISGATTGVEAGQTVTVSLNGHDYTGTVAADHTWSTSVAQADVAALSDGGSYTVHASVSDVAGNPAAADHSLAVDESAAITINTIALDDVVNALESQSALTISGATTGVEAGQTVTVSLNGHDYTGTVAADHTWSTSVAQADVAALSDGGSYTVHASVSDVAGNPAAADHSLAVDESAAITINTIALDDVVNALESQSALTISGATTGVEAGQTVTVSLNGHDYTGTVAADHTWSTSVAQADVAALSDGGSYTVHASVSDVAGNPAAADHSLAVDESAAITINTIALDDVVNALESQSALTISGATTGVEAGQTVTVSLNGHDYTGTVAADHTWSTSVAQADVAALSDGGSYTVHASVSDVAGNPAAADHSLAVDESAAITINTIALDDVVNALESQSALTISGATTGVEAGQTVTVSLNGHDYTGTVAADHTWSTSVAQADVAALSDGGSYTVHASVSDVAGNPAAADHSLAVDESAAITINTIALDDVVNALESQSALTISGATTGVEAGQTVTVSLNGHDYTGTVAADHTWSTSVAQADVAALSDGGSYTVHASVSDVAGNPAAADHSLAVDESAAITINTIALDDVVNALESQSALTISGATTGVEAGQTVTVSLNGHDYTGTVAADHTWSTSVAQADVAALSDGGSYTVHASVSDVAGNPAAADHSLAVDESAAITINTIALDDVVNALESQSALTISGATTGVEAGQTVTVSLNGHDYTGTVAADHTWSTSVAQADVAALSDGGSYTVHASVSDVAGNPAAADHSLAVDESAAITINTIALDDVVNALESQSALTISGATTGVEAGQTVTVSLNGHDYTGTVAADHTWSTSVAQADVAALSDGGSYTVHASVSDVAGNPAAADHSLAVDESAAITINTIALDDVVNALESQSALTISGATTGVEAGQTVTVSLNGHDYTGTVAADHTWSTSVAQADVAALSDGGSYTVHASVSDVAGNPAAADHSLAVDESAAITINTIALDDVVNALESQSALTISGATTGVEAGQTVTVSLNGHDYTGTVAADHTWSTSVAQADVAALSDGGSYTVHASVSDVAGNPAAADHSLAVDESAAITINTIALDDVVNALESQSALTISGATTGVEAGQTVTVSLNGHDYTGTVAADHTWSTSVAQADVAALSDGGSYTVHASVSDVAGNPAAADHSLAVDESAAITINTIALDDVVNALESQSALTISGATTGVEAGQTVTVSLNGHDYTGTVAADHTWSTSVAQADVAALSDGGSYTVHASVSDVAGNPAAADHSLAVDESAAITINTIALDDVVNALESQSALTISGATTGVEAGQTVTVSLNGHDYTGTVAADHTWSTSVAQADVAALSDGGSYTVHASVSDVAGNPAAADHSLAVDESAAITINTIALDDVVNALESQSALTISGATTGVEAGQTVTVSLNGHDYTGTVAADHTWSTSVAQADVAALSDGGSYTVHASVSDVAGNPAAADHSLAVDESAATLAVTAIAPDNGTSGSDFITNTTTVSVSGTIDVADASRSVTVKDGTTTLGTTTADASGNWTLAGVTLAPGSHSLTASATDVAGNLGTSTAQSVTIDTTAPTLAVTAIAPDNGTSGSDFITNTTTVSVSGTIDVADASRSVTVKDGTTTLGTTTADASGNWTLAGVTLAPGSHSLTASATDVAGNLGTSTAQSVTIDTTAPTLAVTAIAPDNGTSGSDFITNTTTVSVSGTIDVADASRSVTVKDGTTTLGTTTADASGNWTLAGVTLAPGSHSLTASATDVAGNLGTSTAQSVTIDTTAPTLAVTAIAPDNGTSGSDFITNTTTVSVSGTIDVADASRSVTVKDGTTTLGTTTADASGNWTLAGVTLAPGSHSLTASATDVAGNLGTSTAQSVTIDTTAPTLAVTAIAPDNGTSGSDFITNTTTVSVSGTIDVADASRSVTVKDGTTTLGTTTADASGNWTLAGVTLAPGSHSLTASATDVAGNLGTSTAQSVTIDTTAPTLAVTAIAPDNGTSGSDFITNTTTVSVSGTIDVADASRSVTVKDGMTTLGTTTADASGNWTLAGVTLAPGSHSLTASATDVAGNLGTSTAQSVTIDTTAPSSLATKTLSLAAGSDSGSSSSDNITNVNTPSVTVSSLAGTAMAVGDIIKIIDTSNGNAVVGSYTVVSGDLTGGTWNGTTKNITTSTLTDGAHNLKVELVDLAGNVGTVSTAALGVTIDTSAGAPSALDLAAADDTGSSNTDNITKNTSALTISGSGENGATVTLFDDANNNGVVNAGESLGTATVSGGTFTLDVSLAASATHNIRAIQTDVAGNVSIASTSHALDITVDTTAPNAPSSLSYNQTTHTITGSAEANSTITVTVQGTNEGTGTTGTGGTFSVPLAPTWPGTKSISVTATDAAGNTSSAGAISSQYPAGVTGSEINLALDNPHDGIGEFTVSIHGLPSGWSLDAGNRVDGDTWTLVSNDLSSLMVMPDSGFIGALVLQVQETWTYQDGTGGYALILNNVEAYAPGSPIFAISGDDNLTASSGHDLLVFSQPIGNDVVHSFDVSADTLDLIGYSGFTTFVDLQAHTADDASGNAVITVTDGQTITLEGVHAADLTSSNFEFDVTPTTENPGAMTIGDGAMLPLTGEIHNTGTISLQSTGDQTTLELIEHGITLDGGGQLVLSDDADNYVVGSVSDVTFTNVDNTISGAGHLGDGMMILVNEGTIIANVTNSLEIDTGTNTIVNSGTLEATGSGGLVIESAVANSGLLWANGGTVTAQAEVTGSGTAEISGTGTMEFGAASSANVIFDATATGHLILDDAFHFTGTVGGLAANDDIDLKGFAFGAGTTVTFAENQAGSGGTLTVSDGGHTANIVLLGQYDPTGFNEKADTTTGTVISYDPHHIA
ncbi:Ig-like domain-containing protein [Bradyrhizobium sp. LLZ17]|uniref:Ig-like domain-containing protein n=1 Tax=Bradyrhizobium sp. LLZ17 TaxID=3239388 RepID=A0AB39XKD2_9BRAD